MSIYGTRPGQATKTAVASRLISEHFASLKNDLASCKEEAAERIVERAKREQDYEFAKKGNKHQFDFNEKVAGVLEDVLALCSSGPSSDSWTILVQRTIYIIRS